MMQKLVLISPSLTTCEGFVNCHTIFLMNSTSKSIIICWRSSKLHITHCYKIYLQNLLLQNLPSPKFCYRKQFISNMASSSSSRNWLCGDFGPGPASSSESPDCPTPPGYFRVSALGRWQCLICRQRFARIRDLRRHIVASHARINWLYEARGEFPFFRRCLACRDQQRSKCRLSVQKFLFDKQAFHPSCK